MTTKKTTRKSAEVIGIAPSIEHWRCARLVALCCGQAFAAMENEMTTTFNNLREMLAHFGCDTPHEFGRMLYKFTDCGPWTAFIVLTKPAMVDMYEIEITEQAGNAHDFKRTLVARALDGDGLPERVIQFLGLERDEPVADNLADYAVLLDNYVNRDVPSYRDAQVKFSAGHDAIGVTLMIDTDQQTRTVYYEDQDARAENPEWLDACVAVDIGSIVEGSDVCVDPDRLTFPFTSDDLDRTVRNVNEVASFYWRRDNSIHGRLIKHFPDDTVEDDNWFTWEFGDDLPQFMDGTMDAADVPQDVLDWIVDHCPNDRDEKFFRKHKLTVQLYCDDSVY